MTISVELILVVPKDNQRLMFRLDINTSLHFKRKTYTLHMHTYDLILVYSAQ